MKSNFEPGYYPDLSNEDYHADGAISSSVIKSFIEADKCLATFQANYIDPDRPKRIESAAMRLGSFAHLAILEPENFDKEYRVLENKEVTTKVPSEWKKFKKNCEEDGLKPLLYSEYEQSILMAAHIKRHELAYSMIKGGTPLIEKSFFVKHEETGLMLKARPDVINHVNNIGNIIVDYKTTGFDLSSETQSKEAFKQLRYVQGAFHKYVIEKERETTIQAVCYVTQMSKYPYLVRCFQMSEEHLTTGLELIEDSLLSINTATKADEWPDYDHDLTQYQAPAWWEYKYN